MTKKRKFRRGGHIISMDELCRQEFVYWNDKITHRGWFMSWQLQMAYQHIGENGCVYYAIKELVCGNCENFDAGSDGGDGWCYEQDRSRCYDDQSCGKFTRRKTEVN